MCFDRTATSLVGVVPGLLHYSFFMLAAVVQKPEDHRDKPEWRGSNSRFAAATSRPARFAG